MRARHAKSPMTSTGDTVHFPHAFKHEETFAAHQALCLYQSSPEEEWYLAVVAAFDPSAQDAHQTSARLTAPTETVQLSA